MLKRAAIIAFGLFVILAVVLAAWLHSTVPRLDGHATLAGLHAPVNIQRDEFGVPHIFAESEVDAYRALGYAQAQDRLFQLDLMRHVASGRLAEWFGPALLPYDKKLRTLGLRAHAVQWLAHHKLAAPVKAALDAYIAGVNDYVAHGQRTLEHQLLRTEVEPFQPADSLAMVGYMAFGFATAFRADPLYTQLSAALGPDKMAALWPDYTAGAALSVSDTETAALFDFRRDILAGMPAPFSGSNGWVIAPQKSASGHALLANDPHIGFANPSVWYDAHVVAEGLDVFGQHLALVPFAILGHKRELAWGLTMYENDDIDLYAETVRGDEVLWQGAYEPLTRREETIVVRGAAAEHIVVRSSRHGPLISDVFANMKDQPKPLAMKWGWLLDDNDPVSAMYNLNHATNLVSFQAALSSLLSPGLNVLYADAIGHIAMFETGVLPRRGAKDGRSIADGASGNDEWTDFVPPEEWPHVIDPPSGFIVSANNKPLAAALPTSEGPYNVEGYWQPPYRSTRITQLLRTKSKWTLDDLREIQNDVLVSSAKTFLNVLLPLVADAPEKEQVKALAAWDQKATLDSTTTGLYFAWRDALVKEIFADELGEAPFEAFAESAESEHSLERALAEPSDPFWDDVRTPAKETPELIAKRALTAAVKAIGKPKRWGSQHTLEFQHPFARGSSIAGWIFDLGPYPVPGGAETVNNFPPDDEGHVHIGPSTRRLIDFAAPAHGFTILPTGESGHRMSPHFGDQARLYVDGRYREVSLDKSDVDKRTSVTLQLLPSH